MAFTCQQTFTLKPIIQLCIIIYNYTILYFLVFSYRWKHDAASNIWWFTKSLPLTATANYSEKFPRFHDFSFERAKCWKYFLMTNFPDMFCKLYGQILNYLHLPDMFCKVDFLSSTCAKFPLHTFQEMEFQMPQIQRCFAVIVNWQNSMIFRSTKIWLLANWKFSNPWEAAQVRTLLPE